MIFWFRKKSWFRCLILLHLSCSLIFGQQLPSGAVLQTGNAKVNYHGSSMYIRQSSSRAVIDWQSFNVGQGGTVHFIQPNQACLLYTSPSPRDRG